MFGLVNKEGDGNKPKNEAKSPTDSAKKYEFIFIPAGNELQKTSILRSGSARMSPMGSKHTVRPNALNHRALSPELFEAVKKIADEQVSSVDFWIYSCDIELATMLGFVPEIDLENTDLIEVLFRIIPTRFTSTPTRWRVYREQPHLYNKRMKNTKLVIDFEKRLAPATPSDRYTKIKPTFAKSMFQYLLFGMSASAILPYTFKGYFASLTDSTWDVLYADLLKIHPEITFSNFSLYILEAARELHTSELHEAVLQFWDNDLSKVRLFYSEMNEKLVELSLLSTLSFKLNKDRILPLDSPHSIREIKIKFKNEPKNVSLLALGHMIAAQKFYFSQLPEIIQQLDKPARVHIGSLQNETNQFSIVFKQIYIYQRANLKIEKNHLKFIPEDPFGDDARIRLSTLQEKLQGSKARAFLKMYEFVSDTLLCLGSLNGMFGLLFDYSENHTYWDATTSEYTPKEGEVGGVYTYQEYLESMASNKALVTSKSKWGRKYSLLRSLKQD